MNRTVVMPARQGRSADARPRSRAVGLLLAAGLLTLLSPMAVARAGTVPRGPGATRLSESAGHPAGLHVIPFPGTPDASSLTRVIFSSLRPSQLVSVTVTGSSSGNHIGKLVALPVDSGTAFVPEEPFTAGELVGVRAQLSSAAAGTASGDPGATVLRFSFRVAVPPGAGGATAAQREAIGPMEDQWRAVGSAATVSARASGSSSTYMSFHSRPHFHPPAVSFSSDPDTGSGDIFISPRDCFAPRGQKPTNCVPKVQRGPMILGPRGQLVWFHPLAGMANNLEVQSYLGHPVLTWWQGALSWPYNSEDVIMNSSYKQVAVVRAGNGYSADLHEFQITPQGTALIDAYPEVRADLSSVGGPSNGIVIDCVVQEVDIKTGQVLWEWHALGHIPLSASYQMPSGSNPYDYLHLNSIQQLPDGNLLVSGRYTSAVYLIDKATGKVLWTLGGKHSSFTMGSGAQFAFQHDARLIGPRLSLFDDASDGTSQEASQSSGEVLKINTKTMTATLAHRYYHSPPLTSGSEGSAETLPNKNVFVGWGAQPDFSEYTAGGRQIFTGSLPLEITSYRAYRFPWSGQPLTDPAMTTSSGQNGTLNVWASWNGATDVATWRVLGGASSSILAPLQSAPRDGFETQIKLPSAPPYVAVQALDSSGNVLGTSQTQPSATSG